MTNLAYRLLILSLLCAPIAAQQQPAPAPRGSATNLTAAARFEQATQNMTPENRTKLAEINKAYTTAASPLYARLTTARKELETAVNQDKMDEAAVRAKAKEIGEIETELALSRAKRYSQFREFLSPEVARRFNQPIPLTRPFQPNFREDQPASPVSPLQVK